MTSDFSGAVLLLGARSEIGMAIAVRLAKKGHRQFVLAARQSDDLEHEEELLRSSGAADITRMEFDADDLVSHEQIVQQTRPLSIVIVAFGILGDQQEAEHNADHAVAIVHTDYVAQVSILTHLANVMREQHSGELVVFSSVAGVRVRRMNYVYGSAKAGLDGFSTGLAAALAGSGAHLLLVRPGFVVGRMTRGMRPAPWPSTPEQVADAVLRAVDKRQDIVWVPPILRYVAAIMRLLPQPVWRRLPR